MGRAIDTLVLNNVSFFVKSFEYSEMETNIIDSIVRQSINLKMREIYL